MGNARWRGRALWPQVFDGFQSTVDWPGGYFYKELRTSTPRPRSSSVSATPKTWQESMRQTVWAVRHGESLVRLLSSAHAHATRRGRPTGMIDGLLRDREGHLPRRAGAERPASH